MSRKGKVIAIDLDETICTGSKGHENETVDGFHIGKYRHCVPIEDNIKKVNKLYEEGNYIIIYTSRGMGTLGGNLELIHKYLYEPTKRDLEKWGVKFNQLVFGKIFYDLLIDDKVLNVKDWR